MKTKNIQLNYMPEFNAFGVSDAKIEKLENDDITPIISLKDEDYKRLGCPKPAADAPTVAFFSDEKRIPIPLIGIMLKPSLKAVSTLNL